MTLRENLRRHKAVTKFIKNCRNDSCNGISYYAKDDCLDGKNNEIVLAFSWDQTPEGHVFWRNIDRDFK